MDVAAPTLDPGPSAETIVGGPLEARWLGRMAYRDAWALQHELVERRVAGRIPDQLLLVEHPAVLTLGRNADEGHVRASFGELSSRGIELIRVERGGEVTYHGPGQLVAYPILALSRRGLLVRPLVRALEAAMAETCAAFGVVAGRREGHPGCWCDVEGVAPRKIGALGIRVERGVSYHGIGLNLDPDLADFDLIDACGMPGVVSTSIARELRGGLMADLGVPRTARERASSGDARLGIMREDADFTFAQAPDPTRCDAQEGITGNRPDAGAIVEALPRETDGSSTSAATDLAAASQGAAGPAAARLAADHAPAAARNMSPDARTGIMAGAEIGDSERRSNPSARDAPRGIGRETSSAGLSVIRAAGIFARALAQHLGAELQGFGADRAADAAGTDDAGGAGTHGAGKT